ncbi:hypothetical protein C2845_PM11G20950 [Panicum miliaceum]|uniref:Uncharacterized protein n=1 Tax=Panicum miliaceum TaxID=4540 RepID=A0A3L6RXG9_PANMI|nr:hypothetical protein C2845_PM11G20950 [Panicum miliaceum]
MASRGTASLRAAASAPNGRCGPCASHRAGASRQGRQSVHSIGASAGGRRCCTAPRALARRGFAARVPVCTLGACIGGRGHRGSTAPCARSRLRGTAGTSYAARPDQQLAC